MSIKSSWKTKCSDNVWITLGEKTHQLGYFTVNLPFELSPRPIISLLRKHVGHTDGAGTIFISIFTASNDCKNDNKFSFS